MYRKRFTSVWLACAVTACLTACQPEPRPEPEWVAWTLSETPDAQSECIVYPEGGEESVLYAVWGMVLELYE